MLSCFVTRTVCWSQWNSPIEINKFNVYLGVTLSVQQEFEPVDLPGHTPGSQLSVRTPTQTHPAACFFSLVQSSRSVKRKT